MFYMVFPGGSEGKESACNTGDLGSVPRVGKSPWRRTWQPTPGFLPAESPWTEEPGGLRSKELQRVGREDMTERLSTAHNHIEGSSGSSAVKKSTCNAADAGSIPESGRLPGKGHSNPLQCSTPQNPIDRGAGGLYSPLGHKRFGRDLLTKPPPP